jgi:hypothetical protein
MSRAGNVDVVTVKPANNIYTVLTLVSTAITLLAFITLYAKASAVFGGGLFS